jgi:hypothetical protein
MSRDCSLAKVLLANTESVRALSRQQFGVQSCISLDRLWHENNSPELVNKKLAWLAEKMASDSS